MINTRMRVKDVTTIPWIPEAWHSRHDMPFQDSFEIIQSLITITWNLNTVGWNPAIISYRIFSTRFQVTENSGSRLEFIEPQLHP